MASSAGFPEEPERTAWCTLALASSCTRTDVTPVVLAIRAAAGIGGTGGSTATAGGCATLAQGAGVRSGAGLAGCAVARGPFAATCRERPAGRPCRCGNAGGATALRAGAVAGGGVRGGGDGRGVRGASEAMESTRMRTTARLCAVSEADRQRTKAAMSRCTSKDSAIAAIATHRTRKGAPLRERLVPFAFRSNLSYWGRRSL